MPRDNGFALFHDPHIVWIPKEARSAALGPPGARSRGPQGEVRRQRERRALDHAKLIRRVLAHAELLFEAGARREADHEGHQDYDAPASLKIGDR